MRRPLVCACLILFLGPAMIKAGIITQTENFSFTAGGAAPIDFDQFNPRGGRRVLTAVELYLQIQESLNISLENYTKSSCQAYVEVKFNNYILDTDGFYWKIPSYSYTAGPVWLMAANQAPLCGPDYASLDTISSQLRTFIYQFADIPAGVIGADIYRIFLQGKPQAQVSGMQLYTLQTSNYQISGSATIIYHYQVIPEPLGLLLWGAGMLHWRRRAKGKNL